jgi:putative addiction module component (TIGR02574 family)
MTANPTLTVASFLEVSEQLPIDDQYELLNRLSERLHGGEDEDDSEVSLSPEWMEEINRRIAEVESGTAELIPAEQVIAELRAQLRIES